MLVRSVLAVLIYVLHKDFRSPCNNTLMNSYVCPWGCGTYAYPTFLIAHIVNAHKTSDDVVPDDRLKAYSAILFLSKEKRKQEDIFDALGLESGFVPSQSGPEPRSENGNLIIEPTLEELKAHPAASMLMCCVNQTCPKNNYRLFGCLEDKMKHSGCGAPVALDEGIRFFTEAEDKDKGQSSQASGRGRGRGKQTKAKKAAMNQEPAAHGRFVFHEQLLGSSRVGETCCPSANLHDKFSFTSC